MDDHGRGKAVRISGGDNWDWQAELQDRRPGIPVFGIFLILLGLFLALNEFFPLAQVAGAVFFLVIGLILLGRWLRDGSHGALYLGAIITALSLADLLTGLNLIHGDGWGTLFLGIAALLIAIIRASRGGGWGWQVVIGVLLVLIGATAVASTYSNYDLNRLTVPILIVVLGLLIISRANFARIR